VQADLAGIHGGKEVPAQKCGQAQGGEAENEETRGEQPRLSKAALEQALIAGAQGLESALEAAEEIDPLDIGVVRLGRGFARLEASGS